MLWVGHVVELKGKDVWCYSDEMESVNLRKCPYDHQLTNKAYLSATTVASIFHSFTYKMAAKTSWYRHGTKLRHCHPVYRERKRADTTGTVPVPWAGHFQ